MKTRLGKRLTALFDAIPTGYDSVWDLCCDHGRLGMALIETGRAPQVHFNDCVGSIMADLEARLIRYGATGYTLHTVEAERLQLPGEGRHLVVLAGVGDEMTIRILEALSLTDSADRFDWLISPANNLFQVRRWLREHGFGVVEEGLVFENGRGYEWLQVTSDRHRAPTPVANPAPFWDARDPQHRAHLAKLVRHARKQRRNPADTDSDAVLAAYEPLLAAD